MEAALATFATSAGSAAAASATASLPWLVPAATSGSFALTGSGILSSAVAMLPSASSAFTLLSGIGSVGGALGQIGAGNQMNATARMQANQELLNARMEKVKAEDTANQLRRNLISNISSANAIFQSRGIGTGSGTPEQAKAEATRNATINIDKARFGGDFASNERIMQAGVYRADGKASKRAGYGAAIDTLSNSKSLRTLLDM